MGLELISMALGSQPQLSVRLRDSTSADVFTALAEDTGELDLNDINFRTN